MELVEGFVHVGTDGERSHPSVGAFVEALDAVGGRHGVTLQAFDARYVVSARHLERALELFKNLRTQQALEEGMSGDMLTLDLRAALDELGAITGEITNEDVLDQIFSRFCIGK